jgi:stage II sporulation protein AA (anti-sigma F factor antagonist)
VAPSELVTHTETTDSTTVVSVVGEVDLVSCDALRHALDGALGTSSRTVVDLTDLSFIDSSGLSVLVEAHRKARDAGGVFVVRNATPMLKRLLDITRLDTLLVLETSPTEAPPDGVNG